MIQPHCALSPGLLEEQTLSSGYGHSEAVVMLHKGYGSGQSGACLASPLGARALPAGAGTEWVTGRWGPGCRGSACVGRWALGLGRILVPSPGAGLAQPRSAFREAAFPATSFCCSKGGCCRTLKMCRNSVGGLDSALIWTVLQRPY